MTVAELIAELSKIDNKSLDVVFSENKTHSIIKKVALIKFGFIPLISLTKQED